jgi:hypothetical protein
MKTNKLYTFSTFINESVETVLDKLTKKRNKIEGIILNILNPMIEAGYEVNFRPAIYYPKDLLIASNISFEIIANPNKIEDDGNYTKYFKKLIDVITKLGIESSYENMDRNKVRFHDKELYCGGSLAFGDGNTPINKYYSTLFVGEYELDTTALAHKWGIPTDGFVFDVNSKTLDIPMSQREYYKLFFPSIIDEEFLDYLLGKKVITLPTEATSNILKYGYINTHQIKVSNYIGTDFEKKMQRVIHKREYTDFGEKIVDILNPEDYYTYHKKYFLKCVEKESNKYDMKYDGGHLIIFLPKIISVATLEIIFGRRARTIQDVITYCIPKYGYNIYLEKYLVEYPNKMDAIIELCRQVGTKD